MIPGIPQLEITRVQQELTGIPREFKKELIGAQLDIKIVKQFPKPEFLSFQDS